MSAPPSPRISRKDRPAALAIPQDDRHAVSDGDVPYTSSCQQHGLLPALTINIAQDQPDEQATRSASVSSALDPYYFGIAESPDHHLSITPDRPPVNEPVTPARNPAAIDRRGLVGVGELATPRWTREPSSDASVDDAQVIVPDRPEDDAPDSPWTIEAIDGEVSDKEEAKPLDLLPPPRPLRTRPSIADESGGEEILYPRNVVPATPSVPPPKHVAQEEQISKTQPAPPFHEPIISSPPSSFASSVRKARKRTSDEFELDQAGTLVSKRGSVGKDRVKEDLKSSVRKHRSLNVSASSSASPRDPKPRERRRESVGLAINSSITSPRASDRHSRHASGSSVSSPSAEGPHSRRVHTTDFSHLPPSPSSSSIQQFLRQGGTKDPPPVQSSPNVAHSLLRGTQEGWSGLDDEATAEALRKLDGLSGKTARARASMASLGRGSSASRPATPSSKGQPQWEGVSGSESVKSKRVSGHVREGTKESRSTPNPTEGQQHQDSPVTTAIVSSSDEPPTMQDKTPKKSRLSFTPKRGSTSSTTYGSTPTSTSRDSASTAATNITSVSASSGGRISSTKARRNSAGSDISSVHSSDVTLLKDRAAHLVSSGDGTDEGVVPPVPPLPKDLSSYRSPPTASSTHTFPSIVTAEDGDVRNSHDTDLDKTVGPRLVTSGHTDSSVLSPADKPPPVVKTPSKKWSFSSALNLKLTSSPSSNKSSFPLSPRSVGFGHGLRKSASKDLENASASSSKAPWTPEQPDAMASAGSLASLSSVGSIRNHALHPVSSKTPDRNRPDTASSASNTTASLSAPTGPLSPNASIKRGQSKRLTPSSIPFFRRSSSQSMQVPSSGGSGHVSSPPPSMPVKQSRTKGVASSPDITTASVSTPGKKTSMLSLGLPSLLKSSSRRSLHSDSKEAAKELQRAKDAARESEKEKARLEKEKQKREDKDRSESRISVLMGRKRGKTLSSTDPRKPKSPVNLPPMQISAIEPVTAQRVAKLKSSTTQSSVNSRTSTSSRVTSQTVSSMQKISDGSLRSRTQLPTIAGSPSVGTNGTNSTQTTIREKDHASLLSSSISGLSKETPTKIPRISSRTSAVPSPSGKHGSSTYTGRRASVNPTGVNTSSTNPSPVSLSTNEFGVIENDDAPTPKNSVRQTTARASPATSIARAPRQSLAATTNNALPRKSARESVSFIGLRKTSTSSVNSLSTPSAPAEPGSHRFSALSPSKGLKLLGPKSSRSGNSSSTQNIRQPMGSPSSSRQSLSTPSPVPSTVDEDEILGDEEMMHYIRRQQAKKLAAGATQEELDGLLKFPEPTPPVPPLSPQQLLQSSQAQYLSDYEKKEILEYPSVYFVGAKSKKKMASPDISANNYSYDDDRGDYQVILGDHLAYRYEVLDTLGKGSFGQVLNCRDHCTGQSVAVKIIRNKKRFHHQALVEIKILDNLRKWDADEKHHVLKMTEHFYFRNHLCIATELLSINLYELIKANGFVGFTTGLIRRFTTQMLMSLSLMRHHRIVHCDLKPENVLLRHPAKSAIKVIDFGSSCLEHEKIYTYIQSRFYRSPEVILGMNYHMAIDMWSLGCILAELYTGFPIFPGENEQEQLSCIMEVLGVPDKEFINRSSRKKLFFDTNGVPRPVVNSKGRRRRPGSKTLAQVLRCNDEEFIDFIAKCLVWDPERRMKPQAAMRHPFVTAGKRKVQQQVTSRGTPSSSTLSSHRSKQVTETPKKSMIGAPTPLTARTPRSTNNGVPVTPSTTSHTSSFASSSRSYRTSQGQSLSSSLHSSRVLNGYSSTSTK